MYETIDLPELKRMAELAANTPEHRFSMSTYGCGARCGTRACLVGTWCFHTPNDSLKVRNVQGRGVRVVAPRFGLPHLVADFLFDGNDNNLCLRYESNLAITLPKWEAISRLRKYIKYVERKRALFQDHADLMAMSKRDRLARLLAPRQPRSVTVMPKTITKFHRCGTAGCGTMIHGSRSICAACALKILRARYRTEGASDELCAALGMVRHQVVSLANRKGLQMTPAAKRSKQRAWNGSYA